MANSTVATLTQLAMTYLLTPPFETAPCATPKPSCEPHLIKSTRLSKFQSDKGSAAFACRDLRASRRKQARRNCTQARARARARARACVGRLRFRFVSGVSTLDQRRLLVGLRECRLQFCLILLL